MDTNVSSSVLSAADSYASLTQGANGVNSSSLSSFTTPSASAIAPEFYLDTSIPSSFNFLSDSAILPSIAQTAISTAEPTLQNVSQISRDLLTGQQNTTPVISFAQGVAAGEPTSNSVVLWTRATDSESRGVTTPLAAQISTDPQFKSDIKTFSGTTDAGRDYTLKLEADGLQSGTKYYYRFQSSYGDYSNVGTFKTVPDATTKAAVSFGFSGDSDGQWRPFGSLKEMPNQNLDYFVFVGDIMYETKSALSPAAADPYADPVQAQVDYERKYRENLTALQTNGFPGTQPIYSAQGVYTLLDNHELGNKQFINGGAPAGTPAGSGVDATNPIYDVNTTGAYINKTTGFKSLIQAYDAYQPIRETTISTPDDPRTDGTQKQYYSQQWGANSIFINVDDRSYRDIRTKTASGADDTGSRADNPDRTMLGKTQLSWLKQTLLDAQHQGTLWKFVAISSPIDQLGVIGDLSGISVTNGNFSTGSDSGKSWIGEYRAERNDLLKFIADNGITNVVFLTTDDHQTRINELEYSPTGDTANQSSYVQMPGNVFQILTGPIGAGGPDGITDHSFNNIKSIADSLAAQQVAKGINPIGLDPNNPYLHDVYREGDPNADITRQPVDFYSPDTFNYSTLSVSADGKTLNVNLYGINSYAANTFPEPSDSNPVRRVLGFSMDAITPPPSTNPKVILISLDGATPRLVNQYLQSGAIPADQGLGLLANKGVSAQQNLTITPSLTAPAHIAIATGSTANNNDINANTFHQVVSPFTQNTSGFAAPIGGYTIRQDGSVSESSEPTANPIWKNLLAAGKTVVAATFPGADGADIKIAGLPNSPIVQPASERTVTYTVPFGEFGGASAKGFSLTASDFTAAPSITVGQLQAAGKVSYSPILEKAALDQFTVGGVKYTIDVAALDTTDDGKVDYDTLVFFDDAQGIPPGPFNLPSTGPAYVKASDNKSSLFYLEGSPNKAGTGFYVSNLAPDLSTVRIARYSANDIPRNSAVLSNVDDINNNVGFWAPQADYRIPEKLSPGFDKFPDSELEAIYEDQVRGFVDYQTRVALRAINQTPNADLALIYIEQPDGSGHQFLLTDPRQATDPTNPNSIGEGQDKTKVARYQSYVQTAYQVANAAVQKVIDQVGVDSNGVPKSDIIVVSDHGFSPFFTTVDLNTYLKNKGFDPNKVRAITSGPAANIYINLQGRETNGTVSREGYITLQKQVTDALKELIDTNPNYTAGVSKVNVFDKVYDRPVPTDLNDPAFGLSTDDYIGQDTGDVFALLTEGYNFDGIQSPAVTRLGDSSTTSSVFSVPNFYGAHGYDPTLPNMSAIFYAAGPSFGKGTLAQVRNIDITPTIDKLLGVQPSSTVQGQPIDTLKPTSK
jgi:phosphodiesterase/alkaline phosphatase D-like protein/predicted AlkP superfamily pyrophosphatase or phosphodiesterase